jgi:hypothetical protein
MPDKSRRDRLPGLLDKPEEEFAVYFDAYSAACCAWVRSPRAMSLFRAVK